MALQLEQHNLPLPRCSTAMTATNLAFVPKGKSENLEPAPSLRARTGPIIFPLNSTALPETRVTHHIKQPNIYSENFIVSKSHLTKVQRRVALGPVPTLQRDSRVRASSQHPTAESDLFQQNPLCSCDCKWDLPPQDAGTGWHVRKCAEWAAGASAMSK